MLASFGSGPIDRWNLIWVLSLMLGVAQLYPWNAFLTATQYFATEFPKFPYAFAMPIAYNWANLGTAFLMIWYGKNFSVKFRMRLSFFLGVLMLVFVPVINMEGIKEHIPEGIRIWSCLGATFISGFSTGVLSSTAFGALAILPPEYTTALMAGQGLAGIAVGALALALSFLIFPATTPAQVLLSGVVFFSTAAFVMLVCTVCNEILLNSQFYRHHEAIALRKDTKIEDLASVNGEEISLIPEGPVTIMSVFKKLWPDALSVFLVFVVTLMIFPGFTVSIPNYDPKLGPKELGPNSTLPTVNIAIFQLLDFVGRTLPRWFVIIPKRFLLVPTLFRFAFIPLWMMMNYMSIFQSNIYTYIFNILMSLSNGYLSTLGMMFGPKRVTPAEAGVAGMVMVACLQFGIFLGVHSALLILMIIKGPKTVIGL